MSGAITIKVPSKRSRVVVIASGKTAKTIAHGSCIGSAIANAKKSGAKNPILVFVPKQGQRYIY